MSGPEEGQGAAAPAAAGDQVEEEVPGGFRRGQIEVQCWNRDPETKAICGEWLGAALENPSFEDVLADDDGTMFHRIVEDYEIPCPKCTARYGHPVLVQVQILVGAQTILEEGEEPPLEEKQGG